MKPEPLESTATLLVRVRSGENGAAGQLLERYMPLLRSWAHGRLAPASRGLMDTDDLVQETLASALGRLAEFEPRHEGAFLAYVRRILLNKIRDQARAASRRPGLVPLGEHEASTQSTPLEEVIGWEAADRYDGALSRLPEDRQAAVILRVELGYSYEALAAAIGCPTANAARLLVTRSLSQLAREMHVER